ncbi:hypothetical protein GCM10025768_27280 [Microbacterium pseudoresistens]|uniref:Uncharacterized protein n=1 Tax=Microbacterium pseudoresistens TaxID=640634 RepID=A0A7Y9EVU6_9MICO|nr:hypothetical protein [Microbacterium pseudoresistens]NYD54739.1 hypothetical protein [Microbacterium pseudoresistens]
MSLDRFTETDGRARVLIRTLIVVIILAIAALVLVGTRVFGLAGAADPVGPGEGSEATVGASPTPTPWATPDAESFSLVEQTELDDILTDPAAHVGEYVIVYAEVLQAADFDSTSIPGTVAYLVSLSAEQPRDNIEFAVTEAILLASADLPTPIATGDLLRARVTVPPPDEAPVSVYREAGLAYPELRMLGAEQAEYRDLALDVTVGEVDWDGELPVLPVSVRNSAARPMTYAIDLMAVMPDGSEAAASTAWTEEIAPGETGSADVTLYGTVPDGVLFRVDSVDRYER